MMHRLRTHGALSANAACKAALARAITLPLCKLHLTLRQLLPVAGIHAVSRRCISSRAAAASPMLDDDDDAPDSEMTAVVTPEQAAVAAINSAVDVYLRFPNDLTSYHLFVAFLRQSPITESSMVTALQRMSEHEFALNCGQSKGFLSSNLINKFLRQLMKRHPPVTATEMDAIYVAASTATRMDGGNRLIDVVTYETLMLWYLSGSRVAAGVAVDTAPVHRLYNRALDNGVRLTSRVNAVYLTALAHDNDVNSIVALIHSVVDHLPAQEQSSRFSTPTAPYLTVTSVTATLPILIAHTERGNTNSIDRSLPNTEAIDSINQIYDACANLHSELTAMPYVLQQQPQQQQSQHKHNYDATTTTTAVTATATPPPSFVFMFPFDQRVFEAFNLSYKRARCALGLIDMRQEEQRMHAEALHVAKTALTAAAAVNNNAAAIAAASEELAAVGTAPASLTSWLSIWRLLLLSPDSTALAASAYFDLFATGCTPLRSAQIAQDEEVAKYQLLSSSSSGDSSNSASNEVTSTVTTTALAIDGMLTTTTTTTAVRRLNASVFERIQRLKTHDAAVNSKRRSMLWQAWQRYVAEHIAANSSRSSSNNNGSHKHHNHDSSDRSSLSSNSTSETSSLPEPFDSAVVHSYFEAQLLHIGPVRVTDLLSQHAAAHPHRLVITYALVKLLINGKHPITQQQPFAHDTRLKVFAQTHNARGRKLDAQRPLTVTHQVTFVAWLQEVRAAETAKLETATAAAMVNTELDAVSAIVAATAQGQTQQSNVAAKR